jgi:hypothetical protein
LFDDDAVTRKYTETVAVDGWQSAGVRGRQRCCEFVNVGRTDWTRQLRAAGSFFGGWSGL